MRMEYEWDENKRITNLEKHGVDFVDAWEMFSLPMLVLADKRFNYGEYRYIGMGAIKKRTVVCAYTLESK